MRSALICVFFAVVVQRGSWADNDFRPTPIPLNDWHYDKREDRAGTLQETIITDAPPTIAAVPAHYWEDALRHSVYLTLVRDKIDQLIAKGDVISPDSKPNQLASKEVDDHDLWEKIKTAPFERIEVEEPSSYGEVTIMAKGRLMEEKSGFRFTEDERSKEKCQKDKCMEGVKAIWSVKRVRQRDVETSPGRYHYELTFSVISQPPKKQRKPYENSIRTFTVRESMPERVVEMPQEHRSYERVPVPTHRPERAIWFHKNIVPTHHHQARQHRNGLDRIFFSLFSDDEGDGYDVRQRYRPPQPPQVAPPYSQLSKVGYVGSPSDQQKRLTPYPYKPHSYKYSRPPLAPPPFPYLQQHFPDTETFGPANNPFGSQSDHRYVPSNKPGKTTRPAVLPTPILPHKNRTLDEDNKNLNTTESTTKVSDIITGHNKPNKPRPMPIKINYMSDHVRPPIYNAPPGVFVTMDKKPFKPMPPLKRVHSRPLKSNKPIDFRPSPQVLDMQQFSEPDPLFDTAFRPITWNYSDNNTTEKIEVAESSTPVNNTRKPNTKGKKPPKKHENIKSDRLTTSTPEIITVSSNAAEESDDMDWANVIGAFTKTTPMGSQKNKAEVSESTTPSSTTSTTTLSTTTKRKRTTTTTESPEETTTTTTPKPKKRTRPPPKFTKTSEKVKKHKRITTTSTKAPEVKTTIDLSPQASSAAATRPAWNTTSSSTTTTTTSTTTTTAKPTTTTTKATTTRQPSTTAEGKNTTVTAKPKTENRFRQSTLLHKGTSVNHDKWNTASTASGERTRTTAASGKYPPRRKGSNFQGYVISSTQTHSDKYDDHEAQSSITSVSTTTEAHKPVSTSTQSYEETADQYESNGESTDYSNNLDDDHYDYNQDDDDRDLRDHTEYIFEPSSTVPSERTNEIIQHEEPITEQIITSVYTMPKNKTKCKKKQNAATTVEPVELSDPTTSTTTETAASIFEELFGSFTVDDSQEKKSTTSKPELDEQETENHSKFVKLDDDLQEFLDSLGKGEDHSEDESVYEDDEKEPSIDDEESPFDNDDENASARDGTDNFDYHERPYSLLELMAME